MTDLTKIFGASGFNARRAAWTTPHNTIPAQEQFLKVVREYGLEVDYIERSGQIVRAHVAGTKKHKSKPGWYVYYDGINISSGAYGDWRTGESMSWCSVSENELTTAQREEWLKQVEAQRKEARAKREELAEATASECKALIATLPLAATHPYLTRKAVKPYGLYIDGEALVVPVRDMQGDIRSLQRIYPNGDKYFTAGGQTAGCFHLIGSAFTEPTYMAEGYATAATIHEVTSKAVIVAFNAGNLAKITASFREAGNKNQLIICADNDRHTEGNPGITAANKAAAEHYAVNVVYPEFAGTEGTDFNDLAAEGGTEAVKAQIIGSAARSPKGIKLLHISELGDVEPTQWLIEEHLPEDSFGVLYGPSGHGKSFVALDMGLCVAAGIPWHGRSVKQGSFVYVCGEGRNGIKKRAAAWAKYHDIDLQSLPFYISSRPVPLLDAESFAEFRAEVMALIDSVGAVAQVTIDTLNRNFGDGDENRTEDMTRFVLACTDIQHDCRASVLVVHHTGLGDSTRARGSSALRAALDFEMQAEKKDENVILSCTKMKDDEPFKPIAFDQETIEITDEAHSCVLTVSKDPDAGKELIANLIGKAKKTGPNQKKVKELLGSYYSRAKANNPAILRVFVERKELYSDLKNAGISDTKTTQYLNWAILEKMVREESPTMYEVLENAL